MSDPGSGGEDVRGGAKGSSWPTGTTESKGFLLFICFSLPFKREMFSAVVRSSSLFKTWNSGSLGSNSYCFVKFWLWQDWRKLFCWRTFWLCSWIGLPARVYSFSVSS